MARLNYGTGTGIATLVNTYTPPTDIPTQVAAQNVRAGQTNVAAQTLAEQQAATYAGMFTPNTTADTTTEDTTDVGTGADDTSGTDTSGTVNTGTTSADGGVTTGGVATTTNTGLTAQDLINDYLESQGIVTDVLTGVNPEILDYVDNNLNNLDLGVDASIADAVGGTDMGMGGNSQINPLVDRPFSQTFFRPQDVPLMESPVIDYMSSTNNFMNNFNPRTDGFGQMPQGFEPMGIETLPNKRGR